MADQDGCHSDLTSQLLRHVTFSRYDAEVKEDNPRSTIYPGGGSHPPPPPGRRRPRIGQILTNREGTGDK